MANNNFDVVPEEARILQSFQHEEAAGIAQVCDKAALVVRSRLRGNATCKRHFEVRAAMSAVLAFYAMQLAART